MVYKVFCVTVESTAKHTDVFSALKTETVGVGPTNPPSVVDMAHVEPRNTSLVGVLHGDSLKDKKDKTSAEHALVNFIGLSYTGYVCGVVHGLVSANSSCVVGHDAHVEHHANDVGS